MAVARMKGLNQAQVGEVQSLLFAVYTNHMVADHDANRVKRPILSIIHDLSESDNFDEFFNRSKQTIREDGILFDEETFISSIRNGGHLNNNEAQFLLRRLAEVNLPRNVNIAGPSKVNIEHIYPQTPTRENGWITQATCRSFPTMK